MFDGESPGLGVGFAIDAQGAIDTVDRIETAYGGMATKVIADIGKAEAATEGAFTAVSARVTAATASAERAYKQVGASKKSVENAGEKMVVALEREILAFGKTRDEVRMMNAEFKAVDADGKQLTELAGRIRANAAALAELRADAAIEAANKEAAAIRAVNNQLAERAQIEASLERTTGVSRTSAVDAGATFSALNARAAEEEATAVREAAFAYDMFEAKARQGAQAMRELEAARAASQIESEAQAVREAAFAYEMFEAKVREGAKAMRELEAAQAAEASSLQSLRSSIDPLFTTHQRLTRELENAARLYRSGAIGQEEYARSSGILAQRLNDVQQAQARASETVLDNRPGLQAQDMVNIIAQLNDIGVSLAGGQNPLLVLIQQGSQLGGIMTATGVGIGGMAKAIGGLFIVTTPTVAAVEHLAFVEAQLAGVTTMASSASARAAITAAELAVAEEMAARAGIADAAAQNAVALARVEAAGAAEVAAAANRQLAAAQLATSNAAAVAAATATRSLAPWIMMSGAIAAPFAIAGVAIWRFQQQVNDDANLKKFAAGLGLTKDEMKKLGDVSVTTGDMFSGLWTTIQDRLNVKIDGKKIIDYLFGPNDAQQVGNFIAEIWGLFVGGYKGIVAVWGMLPAALGDVFIQATNAAIGAIEGMVNKSIAAVNALAAGANGVLGISLFGQIDNVQIARVANSYAGAGKKVVESFTSAIRAEKSNAMAAMTGFFSDVGKNAQAAAEKRVTADANKIKEDRSPKKDKVDRTGERLARENEAIEAQIRNLYKLADAYRISDAAALIAEARVKAESDAIKKRGDIEMFVDRQIRLAIAQRVSDAEKAAAGERNRAQATEEVNRLVAAGLVPSERAADLVRDRIADLPLLAAIEAAQQRGLTAAAQNATKALDDQRRSRERLTGAEEAARFTADMTSGGNRLAELAEEYRLVGATDGVRARALATIRATQEAEAKFTDPARRSAYIAQQVQIAAETDRIALATRNLNDELAFSANRWDLIAQNVQNAARGMADAFGTAGRALGDVAAIFANYHADRERLEAQHRAAIIATGGVESAIARENAKFALATATRQVGAFGDMTSAAKGFFGEGTKGYKALETAEKTFRAIEFALSVRAMAQDAIETASSIAKSGIRAAKYGIEAVAKAISSLPFPANLVAGAATAAALAAIGLSIAGSFGGGKNTLEKANEGTGTVFGDAAAKSESISRAIDSLKEVDTLMLASSRDMAASLRSIDSQIGNVAALVVRAGNIDANAGVTEGFKANTIGSILGAIPLVGGLLKSLFGSTTSVIGSGLYSDPQSLGSVLNGGFDASYYSDVEKKKKFFGITTGKSYSTQYTGADAGLENQFTLILRSFNDAIAAAAGPLGASTSEIEQRLSGFVVTLGKIDTKGLTGEQIQEKLAAVFGAAADGMAAAAIPGIERFQKVGEGAFETLVRVASTVETVTDSLDRMGMASRALSIDAKLGIVEQFDSVRDFTSASGAYFDAYYSKAEQNAATLARFGQVFVSMGVTLPETLGGFRALVEAQDLTTAAGQATYATLLQLAPAFADLKASMDGAKSAADVLSERQDLERKLLELRGDTAAIRALDLAKLDASNRALQEQVWAMQDGQEAARAADELRKAWGAVGDSIMDEVRRIRGLTETGTAGGFATLQGRFNATTALARGGDQDAAKLLPGLSQELLRAAGDAASSRQELDRVQAQTAASLEETFQAISRLASATPTAASTQALLEAMTTATTTTAPGAANENMASEIRALRDELAQLRADNNAGHAATAGNTGRIARKLDDVSPGGDSIAVEIAA